MTPCPASSACTETAARRAFDPGNIILDGERAAKLTRLAERTHVQEGTLARSLPASALDEADPDPRHVVELLDGIPGAHERAGLGRRQAKAGETVPLDEL